MNFRLLACGVLLLYGVSCRASCAAAAEASSSYESDVRPLLAARCGKCHGAEKQKGGLRLDVQASVLKGGDSELPAVVPHDSSASRLMQVVRSTDPSERMPPDGAPLSDAEIALLQRWIDAGAAWPKSAAGATGTQHAEMQVTAADRQHWAFLPLQSIAAPPVRDAAWPRTVIDRFILHKLEASGLQPSVEAQRRTLVRRLYLDVTGLPPSAAEVESFVATTDPAAYEQLVDRLLASQHYGERWARHWLDVARYADSNGQEADEDRPTAYHFRDFVIRALNDDMPFDQFVRWQIAGDEFEPDNPLAVAATGFLTAGANTRRAVELMEEERLRIRYNELDDMIATTGSAMLGLTLGCARCHDHKYDPIPTRDYYRLMAAYHSGDRAEVPLAARAEVAAHREQTSAWEQRRDAAQAALNDWLDEQKKPLTQALRDARIAGLPIDEEDRVRLNDPQQKNSPEVKSLLKKHGKAIEPADDDYRARFSEEQRSKWQELAAALEQIEETRPRPLPTAYAMADFGEVPVETWLFDRGEFLSKREPVQLGFLTVLTGNISPGEYLNEARRARPRNGSTYQRKALALWTTDVENGAGALVARVIVNRLWQHHFGHGLVRTVNDFGTRGEPPSHPELLQWLADSLVQGGWRLKPLQRLILTSSTYRQSSALDPHRAKIDPDNRLLWRWPMQRIESEILRDAMLAAAGSLNLAMYGPAFKPPIATEAMQARNLKTPYPKDAQDQPATRRRSVYLFHKRVIQYPLMQAFDGPDATASCGVRNRTTVATQGLALLNDRFVRLRAAEFAERLLAARDDTAEQVRQSYAIAFGRLPSDPELATATAFIDTQTRARRERSPKEASDARRLALTDYCQALFGLNEFLYVE